MPFSIQSTISMISTNPYGSIRTLNRAFGKHIMSSINRNPIILAILIITMGVGWLLTVKNVIPGINWVWTLALAVVGLLTFVMNGGLNKYSIVVGSFFLVASVISVFRQSGTLETNVEVPILFILFGILLLIAQHPAIPFPAWFVAPNQDEKKP